MDNIARILKKWPFSPENSIRKIVDSDGTEKIQVRVDQGAFQGVLQMELDGRPDGKKPHKMKFALDYYQSKLHQHITDEGTEDGFNLSKKICEELFDESRRIYDRYVFLLQIQDYNRVIQDTEQNMDLFRFVNRYAKRRKDRVHLEKWWPYVLRIHAVARVMISAQNSDYESGINIIQETLQNIQELENVDAEEFKIEKRRSRQALKELKRELEGKRPLTEIERLKNDLTGAIDKENFEKAAKIRDKIHDLQESTENQMPFQGTFTAN